MQNDHASPAVPPSATATWPPRFPSDLEFLARFYLGLERPLPWIKAGDTALGDGMINAKLDRRYDGVAVE
jgi:hypothetical protein